MDLVKILSEAIQRLPEGDHSTGLVAIMRHISIAIRHFDRRGERDADSFTDAIYRTNQAYEGSLKEAYRVLAGKDPMGKTPNEIEKYLESKKIVRPRVLTQLGRYRQDYRNPSTHDYKLDFDEDEALLAIVSVCAFTKLLIDQISERVAFNLAAAAPSPAGAKELSFNDKSEFISNIVQSSLIYTRDAELSLTSSEFEGGLAGNLTSLGLTVDLEARIKNDEDNFKWDLMVSFNEFQMPIETRASSREFDKTEPYGIHFLHKNVIDGDYISGLLILNSSSDTSYNIFKLATSSAELYIICRYSIENIKQMSKLDGTVEIIS